MTGAVLGTRCFASADDAADAYFSGAAPSLVAGSTSYLNQFVKVSGVWNLKQYSIDSGGTSTLVYTAVAAVPAFPSCDESAPFLDGMSIGWAISAALVAVACFKLMQKAAS